MGLRSFTCGLSYNRPSFRICSEFQYPKQITVARSYCVPKFGMGTPRFQKYVPDLKGDPVDLGEETQEEFEKRLKDVHPEREYENVDKLMEKWKVQLAAEPKQGQVVKLEDGVMKSYTIEEYFGISSENLQTICDVVAGRDKKPIPKIQTIRRLDHTSFVQLLTIQSRNNKSDQAFRSLQAMQVRIIFIFFPGNVSAYIINFFVTRI